MTRYEFPWPPKELSPNARVHWRTLAEAKAQYREDCGWLLAGWASGGRRAPTSPVTAQVTFVVADKRRRDSDNYLAMLKPMWDALVDLEVLGDDSHDKLRIAEPKWARDNRKYVIVELTGGRE